MTLQTTEPEVRVETFHERRCRAYGITPEEFAAGTRRIGTFVWWGLAVIVAVVLVTGMWWALPFIAVLAVANLIPNRSADDVG